MVFRLLRLRCRISSNNEVLDFAFDTNDYGKLSIRKNSYTAMFNTLPYWSLRLKRNSGPIPYSSNPSRQFMFKVNNRNTKARCEIMFKVNKNTSTMPLIVLVSYLTPCSRVSIVNFEQVDPDWDLVAWVLLQQPSELVKKYNDKIAAVEINHFSNFSVFLAKFCQP